MTDRDEQQPKKKGFWGGLFRTRSSATKSGKLEKVSYHGRRASEGDALHSNHRRRSDPEEFEDDDNRPAAVATTSSDPRRRPRRPDPSKDAKGKGRDTSGGQGAYDPGPLTEWPPSGMSSREELSLGPAMRLIARGVPAFRGHKRPIPHAPDHYYALFATTAGNRGDETDAANLHASMTQLMTLRLLGSGPATYPWETLEQPSYAFCFGKRPGTITLNHWVSTASVLPPAIALRDSGMVPREIELDRIFERLKFLERGLEDDNEDLLYKNLYRRLLRDPDRYLTPHRTLDKQITDLIMVLSRPDWIDYTNPRNQVVTKFIFDTSAANAKIYHKFFHQLLLSVELDLRINSKHHITEAKEKLLTQIPPTIQWNLALARRWRENVRIETYGKIPDQTCLRLKLKKRQVRMLKRFAQMMKWPNLAETLDNLRHRDVSSTLDRVSSHALAFFSGLVLPGPTFPFLIINSLIDVDPDRATDDLALLTHVHPSCGFQYRSSYTYWTATSIVGKVLAPTCHSVAGWVGPARPSVDLSRSQIARIRSRRPLQRGVTPEDIRTMSERSDPLGPPTQVFPVKEYSLVTADPEEEDDYYDLVRIEMLSLRACADRAHEAGPTWFNASIQFAIDGVSWPLRLTFNVSFVHAWPCSDGPHPLFFDYVFERVTADELVGIKDWNGLYGGYNSLSADSKNRRQSMRTARSLSPPAAGQSNDGGGASASSKQKAMSGSNLNANASVAGGGDEEKVLVVDAFGVHDNEVLARAWCSHWGLSAVVADIGTTCMACAIREAYAATLTVVILVDGAQAVDRDD
ncbi:hypothetical protein B0H66DRAFT_340368 [Apodospora peruviana]|uniref:VTC domain-containing protein n=1 Tax=Apodospora peruviana TaxID=516989 RepID=A0AAE0I0D9_9PEZI|nr:hypothetical protein B0H66DRAFT_340368 [Apodospora peruviana]